MAKMTENSKFQRYYRIQWTKYSQKKYFKNLCGFSFLKNETKNENNCQSEIANLERTHISSQVIKKRAIFTS